MLRKTKQNRNQAKSVDHLKRKYLTIKNRIVLDDICKFVDRDTFGHRKNLPAKNSNQTSLKLEK